MKKLAILTLTVVMLFAATIPCFAVQIIGQVLSTDIRAYINGAEIPAYNIDGKLAVVVSDLNNYGFKTQYNNTLRKSSVTRNPSATTFTSVTSKASGLPIGTRVMDVYKSDITVELDGRAVQAFNVDNCMAIYFTELKGYGTYWYDNNNRSSNLTLGNGYTPQPVYLVDTLKPYDSNDFEEFANGNFVMMGGEKRYNGFSLEVYGWNGQSCAVYNINGQYTKVTGLISYVDGKTGSGDTWDANIYADDRLVYTCSVKPGDLPKEFSADISNAKKLEFRTGTTNGRRGTIGFAEIQITGGGTPASTGVNQNYGNAVNLVDVLQPYESNDYEVFMNGVSKMMGGEKRYNGFSLSVYGWNGQSCAVYNLGGKYTKLTGITSYIDNETKDGDTWDVRIYADGILVYTSPVKPGDLPQSFVIDVTGVSKLEFQAGERNGRHGFIGFGELKLYS